MADKSTDDPIVVSEAAVAEHEPAVRGILVEYVTWLENVVAEAVEGEYDTDFDALVESDLDRLRDPGEPTVLFLARADDRVVGLVYLRAASETVAVVKRLYVRPEYRRRGVGRALVTELVETAADRGYDALRLTTSPGMEAAHRLYADLGFVETEPFDTEVPAEFHHVCRFMRRPLDDE